MMRRMFVAWIAALVLALVASSPAFGQRAYVVPEAAANALVDAMARSDGDAMKRVLGPRYKDLLPQDGVDRENIYAFLGAWAKRHAVEEEGDRRAWLVVGESGWKFPVPMARTREGWRFDLRAGEQELRARRIGRNELAAIDTLGQLAGAQRRYVAGTGAGRHATRLVSRPGKTDGLYWPSGLRGNTSPLGSDALVMGADTPAGDALHGYHYRIGTSAGGRYVFVAWPARYGSTGVHTFVRDSNGTVYQRDLGADTAARARTIGPVAPDAGWQKVR